jgi:hypothetical protein
MDDELSGWKAIADYLGTSERTAQRWERDLGLPVRRGGAAKGTTVVATPSDLDQWRSSPVGLRAEGARALDSSEQAASATAEGARRESGDNVGVATAVVEQGSTRRPRGRMVVGGLSAALLVLALLGWLVGPGLLSRPQHSNLASNRTAVASLSGPGAGGVVVLKLTAASGEAWSLRVKSGTMATWEAGTGRILGIVAAVDGAVARVTLTETERSTTGTERRIWQGNESLARGVSAPIRFAGSRMLLEWVGTEGTSPPGEQGETVAPPRCCVMCGGVTACATEVAGWCGSCCDPRFTSCRPPR